MIITSIKNNLQSLQRPTIHSGTLEAIKWLALALMTLDHVNRFVYGGTIPGLTEASRMALPLFAFIFGYNLSSPHHNHQETYKRAIIKPALAGLVATPAMYALSGSLLPLNVLFLFSISAAVIYLKDYKGYLGIVISFVIVMVGGAGTEYWWLGIFVILTSWFYCKYPNAHSLALLIMAVYSLTLINENLWSLMSIPLVFLIARFNMPIPRWKYAFYIYYPLHLYFIWFYLVGSH